jgi:putative ABC transport system permease protein
MGPLLRALLQKRAASLLMILETAFGLAVAVHASALALHYVRSVAGPMGFDSGAFLLVNTERDGPNIASFAEHESMVQRDVEALSRAPGVRGAAEATAAPLNRAHREMLEAAGAAAAVPAWILDDRGGLTSALGVGIVEGRALAPADVSRRDATPAVVTRALASRLFPGVSPLGKQLRRSARERPAVIVGVVASFRATAYATDGNDSVLLVADPPPLGRTLTYIVRVADGAVDAEAGVRAALERVDARRAVLPRRLVEGANLAASTNRGAGGIALFMAGMILLVVFLGRVAMSSLVVIERRKEIGIRRALGATRGDVARLVLAEHALLSTAGLAAGAVAIVAFRVVASARTPELVGRFEPLHVAGVSFAMWLTGMAAALVPALQASSISPAETSRS